MGDTTAVGEPRGTVFFERTVNLGDYNSTKVGISVQFPVSWDVQEGGELTAAAAKEALFQAKLVTFEQLGIKAEYDSEAGVLREVMESTFGAVRNVTGTAQANPANDAPAAAPQQAAQPAAAGEAQCPKCSGPMYDNRASKTNPKQPDFRCKAYKPAPDGTDCKGVIWPPRGN